MPYRKEPPWARWLEEVIHVTRYLTLALAGIVALTAAQTPGLPLAGSFITFCAMLSLVGVITRRYHIELIGLYFLAAAVCAASASMFLASFLTVAWLTFALVPLLAERLLYLHLIAVEARKRAKR